MSFMSNRKENSYVKNIAQNRRLFTFVMILVLIFILGGGIYDLIRNPGSAVSTSGGGYSYVAGQGEQTIIESLVSMILYGFGFTGLYLVLKASQVLYDKTRLNTLLSFGIGLTVISFLGLTLLNQMKRGIF